MSTPTNEVVAPQSWATSGDRAYISRLSPGPLVVYVSGPFGEPASPDSFVRLSLTAEFEGGPDAFTAVGSPMPNEPGRYYVVLPAVATSTPGPYLARWDYEVGGIALAGEQSILIGDSAPAYDSLNQAMKNVVEGVWIKVADQFDSPFGGPHLQVYMQGHFGRNRIAQLLSVAVGRMNSISQPHMTYAINKDFPHAKWGPLLGQALWVETIKHLRVSYLEQPDPIGVNVARLDRSSYMARWGEILRDEQGDLNRMLEHFKIASLNLGGGARLTVAGGIFPRVGVESSMHYAAPRGIYLGR